ncbi:MAG TPA: FAD-dependent oxidoreductase [Candidatus Limnocylindrales bacterium]|nr:FAD-dependent oxidoreductase [Candidatus Limnocylindrales bacterium]
MTAARPTPDVAVIGGGIVGAATAAFLAADGAAVTLWERTEIAAAASGRNSGVVQHPFDPVLVELYRQTLALYRVLASTAASAAPFDFAAEPAGLMLVGGGEDGAAAAADLARAWAAAYPDARPELVAGAALRSLEPGLADDVTACRLAIGYPVAPASATRAFAALAAARGATVVTGRTVRPEIRDGVAIGVAVDGEVRPADTVVVAAGPWAPDLLRGAFDVPIVPVWGVVAGIDLPDPPRHVLEEIEIDIEPADAGEPADGDGEAAGGGEGDGAFGFSLVTAGRASALGSTFLADEPDPAAVVDRLRDRGARYVPALAIAPLTGVRACARPVSVDRRPIVGRVPGVDGAFICAGHGPWGISTGPATARMVADLVLGRPAGIPMGLDPARFGR